MSALVRTQKTTTTSQQQTIFWWLSQKKDGKKANWLWRQLSHFSDWEAASVAVLSKNNLRDL